MFKPPSWRVAKNLSVWGVCCSVCYAHLPPGLTDPVFPMHRLVESVWRCDSHIRLCSCFLRCAKICTCSTRRYVQQKPLLGVSEIEGTFLGSFPITRESYYLGVYFKGTLLFVIPPHVCFVHPNSLPAQELETRMPSPVPLGSEQSGSSPVVPSFPFR